MGVMTIPPLQEPEATPTFFIPMSFKLPLSVSTLLLLRAITFEK